MFTTLRAFAWLRWRLFINSLEQTGSRDMLERFSLAIEKLGPILAGMLLIPSALTLAALGAASGFALARGDLESIPALAPRYLLFAVPLLSIAGPLLMHGGDRTNPVRMLLLPIGRGTLYVAQSAAALGDFWTLLMLPLVTCIPIGLAAGGAPVAALFAVAAGAMLILVVVAITSTTTSLLHLAVRDRRRGELLALLVLLVLPMIGMLPTILSGGIHGRGHDRGAAAPRERRAAPPWVTASARRALALYPTELYTRATRDAAAHAAGPAARSVVALAAGALLLNGLGLYVFGKVLESPGSSGGRRRTAGRLIGARRLPWLSAGASAVALGQLRLALRTPRGRSILLSPIVLVFVYGALNFQNTTGFHLGGLTADSGLVIASFASFVCLMSILPIALNQFAIDKAGLTLVLLSPLSDRDYLTGKAVGNGMVAALPTLFCMAAAFVALPGSRSIASWMAIPVALASTYFLVAPAAATFSAMFPRVVDLNSIGRGSNAHGLSGLLGVLTFLAAGVPNLAIAAAASHRFGRPPVTLGLLLVWCGLTFLTGRLLFVPVRRVFASRRENLAML
jgi:hypothetical protein